MIEKLPIENREPIRENLERGWLCEGRIVVFVVTATPQENVDAWFNTVLATVEDWNPTQPYLELHDMRAISITPYNRKRAQELVSKISHRRGRSAILIASGRLGEVMRFFINNVLNRQTQNLERKAFTSVDDALVWLKEAL